MSQAQGALLYAALVLLTVLGSGAALDRGAAAPGVIVFAGVAALCVLSLCERRWPLQRAWLSGGGDVRVDVAHGLLSNGLAQGARTLLALLLARAGLSRLVDGGALPLWPAGWPLVAQLLLALLLEELCTYWIHRAQHQIPWLWRFHAVHHSSGRLYALNQLRNHPVDLLMSGLALAPLVILGMPERALTIFTALLSVLLLLQHSNLALGSGRLWSWLNVAELHRWHHSCEPAEANRNYGGALLLFDRLHGTLLAPPAGAAPPRLGVSADRPFPAGYLEQLRSPFAARHFTAPGPRP